MGEVSIAGKADISVGGENDGAIMYGVYAQEHSKVAFADDARITTTTHAGDSNAKMYGIHSRTDAEVAFAKGLTVKNGNLGAAMIAEGGKVEVNMAGGNDVKLEGTVGSSAMYNSAHELTYGTVKSILIRRSPIFQAEAIRQRAVLMICNLTMALIGI